MLPRVSVTRYPETVESDFFGPLLAFPMCSGHQQDCNFLFLSLFLPFFTFSTFFILIFNFYKLCPKRPCHLHHKICHIWQVGKIS